MKIEQLIVSKMDLLSLTSSCLVLLLFVKVSTSDEGPGVNETIPPTGEPSLMSPTIVTSTSEQPGRNSHLIRSMYLPKQYDLSNFVHPGSALTMTHIYPAHDNEFLWLRLRNRTEKGRRILCLKFIADVPEFNLMAYKISVFLFKIVS